jgi:hypothetical protein
LKARAAAQQPKPCRIRKAYMGLDAHAVVSDSLPFDSQHAALLRRPGSGFEPKTTPPHRGTFVHKVTA